MRFLSREDEDLTSPLATMEQRAELERRRHLRASALKLLMEQPDEPCLAGHRAHHQRVDGLRERAAVRWLFGWNVWNAERLGQYAEVGPVTRTPKHKGLAGRLLRLVS